MPSVPGADDMSNVEWNTYIATFSSNSSLYSAQARARLTHLAAHKKKKGTLLQLKNFRKINEDSSTNHELKTVIRDISSCI
jgi:hypothetical protein